MPAARRELAGGFLLSCQKAREIDMAAYIADPGERQWEAFRAHFPGCRECSEAVAEWTGLEDSLRSGSETDAHPAPELLAALAEAPNSVPAATRRHVESCRTCGDELAALTAFPFERLEATAPLTPGRALRRAMSSLRDLGLALVGRGAESDRPGWKGEGIFGAPEPQLVFQSSAPGQAPEAAEERAPLAVLAAGSGPLHGQVFPIAAGESRLGRGPDCEIRLRGGDFSRLEATFRADRQQIEVISRNPRRPVLVNGTAVAAGPLSDGDRLEIGSQHFEIRLLGSGRQPGGEPAS